MSARTHAPVLGVLGSSGGLGASTLAVALARAAAAVHPPVACVDGHLSGGGLDVTACVEHLPGLRWQDLAGARGEVSGEDLLAGLPAADGVRVLSAAPPSGEGSPPPAAVVESVLRSLSRAAGLVVVDLPSRSLDEPFLEACDSVVLLCGVSARHLADALAAATDAVAACPDTWLVVRGAPRGADFPETIATHLDLPLAGTWRDDPKVAADSEQGRSPGSRSRSALAALCGSLLDQVVPRGRAA